MIAHAAFLTEGIREHADVVFPAEAYAEKEGTIVHPDGRLQRLRPAIARPGEVRAEWQVLAELALRARRWTSTCSTAPMASQQLFDAVPFYAGPDARGDRRARRALAGARGRGGVPRRRRRAGAPQARHAPARGERRA